MRPVGFILIVYPANLMMQVSLYGKLNLLEWMVVCGNKKTLHLLGIDKGEQYGTTN